ncbi:MAG: PD-(D/E)XK nuclease family protein [Elusimicrobia bacterium]|nr:PD-(D/E)XK nuclease family protein [Elusimicrobiota bacterium]
MREFFLEYKLLILTVSAILFALIFIDIVFKSAKHKIKKKKDFYKKNYGDGTIIYAGTEGGLLSYQIDPVRNGVPQSGISNRVDDTVVLMGKPDLVMQDKKTKEVFVIDLKSGKSPQDMSMSHSLQLAAYFLMIEKNFSTPVKRGIIRYLDDDNKEHSVENSDELKNELLERVRAIADAKKKISKNEIPELVRNHNISHRCKACEFASECPQVLV